MQGNATSTIKLTTENKENEHLSYSQIYKICLMFTTTIYGPYKAQSIENVTIQWLVT
jgi:hypothetical protein